MKTHEADISDSSVALDEISHEIVTSTSQSGGNTLLQFIAEDILFLFLLLLNLNLKITINARANLIIFIS